ncbi:MAG: (d)CMP kinase [Clostridiales bacterium]|nr:(d)CMP kinase [Clostridiales bacterium]
MINITIDGPSGAGKSTVARAVAKKLGYIYLDTGAIYRALAYTALNAGVDVTDGKRVSEYIAAVDADVRYEGGEQRVFSGGIDVTEHIRAHRISKAASDISKHTEVRIKLSEIQRKIAAANNAVLDGRDAGTYVLPNAKYKFFLTADIGERARRRYAELALKGAEITIERVLKDIEARDYNDTNRDFAPLRQALDAEYIDSTGKSAEEVAEYIVGKVEN